MLRRIPFLFLGLSLLVSCKSYPIKTYSIPKETVQTPALQVADNQANPFLWERPKHWVEGPSSGMLLAGFVVGKSGMEVTIVGLPGGGDLLANVNRWRGQLQLAPIDDSGLQAVSGPLQHAHWPMIGVELYGAEKGIVAVLFERNDQTYFIKLMGPVADVKKEKAIFFTFVKSVTDANH